MDFETIFEEKYTKFYRYSFFLTKDKFFAEDLVMEVFKILLERSEPIPSDWNIEAYIIRSIKNHYLNRLKSGKRQVSLDSEDEQLVSDQTSQAGVLADSSLSDLVKTLEALGEACKNVLSLVGLGYGYAEIAKIEGLSVGTVNSRMSRCRARLLDEYGE